ncbi:hypothetical protein [Hoeflea sp.]|uniref:hypothetical protein n=1 Tax=Hoeflea sp. TaxID=1940281 RepID=UPI003B01D2CA
MVEKGYRRRDIIASLAGAAALLAGNSPAFACEARRSRIHGLSAKSYSCDLGRGRLLNTTFLRVSDLVFDKGGRATLPDGFGSYEDLVNSHVILPTRTLDTFQSLMDRFSYPFEPWGVFFEFDGRESGHRVAERFAPTDDSPQAARWRTLGVWDDPYYNEKLFPLPDVLREAMRDDGRNASAFLRFASQVDFEDIDEKIRSYVNLWRSHPDYQNVGNGHPGLSGFEHVKLLQFIDAGSVERFVPLHFYDGFSYDECTYEPFGGAHCTMPALYVDLAICRNDGSADIQIDDFFGHIDNREWLRPYSAQKPAGEQAFNAPPLNLRPGDGTLMVQRLLFHSDAKDVESSRAVFGPAYLPKAVVVDGQINRFDGRSHNALIISSYFPRGCCPYLYSWCDRTEEWISLGKVITECVGRRNMGEERRQFGDLRTRFYLAEREHERTVLQRLVLEVVLKDGSRIEIVHADADVVLEIGDSHEFAFSLPKGVSRKDVVGSTLEVAGYYEPYRKSDFAGIQGPVEAI